ncbi:MAG: hypothetical protein HS104_25395 [Polyangiaceae bacterium]|nr:hypothetical protein [Polyangiaceae bacterium]MCE7890914.1 hypothetical protein [Sorangiineae bacterium PRO1]MCL4753987.1 hypothetical protein [Myxococcales bacterium]
MRVANALFILALLMGGCGGSTSGEGTGGSSSGGSSSGGASSGGTSSGGASSGGSGGTGAVSGSGGAGGSPSWTACKDPGTCQLLPTNCCGYCGPAPLSGFEAVNESHVQDYTAQTCADPQACPDCITFEEPNYLALCRNGTCTEVDLRLDALSACSGDGDCRLRYGAGCCESCGGMGLVALNKDAKLGAEVCSPFAGACPPCVPPPYPSTALAVCQAGHCVVKNTGLGGP